MVGVNDQRPDGLYSECIQGTRKQQRMLAVAGVFAFFQCFDRRVSLGWTVGVEQVISWRSAP
jgi:hypothetical protein